jgi:hypothetical protein
MLGISRAAKPLSRLPAKAQRAAAGVSRADSLLFLTAKGRKKIISEP